MSFRSFATISTIGTSIVLSMTGISMLVGHGDGNIGPIHELAGIFFLITVAMHIYVNRKSIFKHFSSIGGKMTIVFSVIVGVLVLVLN